MRIAIRGHLKKYKYLLPSASLLVVILVMLAFDSDNFVNFFTKTGKIFLDASLMGLGIYIMSLFSMWLFYPFAPKHENFSNDAERENYFKFFSQDLLLFIYMIIAATLVIQ